MYQIDKITVSDQPDVSNIAYKTSSVSMGFDGTFNVLSYKNYSKISDGRYFYAGVGLGASFISFGISFDSKYNDSGTSFLVSSGFVYLGGILDTPVFNLLAVSSINLRLGNSSLFLNLGATFGLFYSPDFTRNGVGGIGSPNLSLSYKF